MHRLNISDEKFRYRALIGTGGIGSGSFFALNGNHTLGREESRSGRFIQRRDYCKLHIVSHYVKTLLGVKFETFPVGLVGEDDSGRRLFGEMEQAGLNMKYVERSKDFPTLFSFCFIYPDGSGGNMTVDNSACSRVSPDYVGKSEKTFGRYRKKGIALAVPEVGLDARKKILELGNKNSFFCVASFTTEEMKNVKALDLLRNVDLLAANIDEAASASGLKDRPVDPELDTGPDPDPDLIEIVKTSIRSLLIIKQSMYISITAGRSGSWVWDGKDICYLPAIQVDAVSTAGAGDAFLAGLICGLTAGLGFSRAHEIGALTGGLSVTSPHTIHKGVDKQSLFEFARSGSLGISDEVKKLLEQE